MGAPIGNRNAAGSRGGSKNPLRKDKGFMKLVSQEKSKERYKLQAAAKSAAKKKALNETFKRYGREQRAKR